MLKSFLLVWLFAIAGWILNVYQVVHTMPATFAAATPWFVFKALCIVPLAPVGSVLGWIGLFT